MNNSIKKYRYGILTMLLLLFCLVNAQDSKPIVKPKPPVIKSQPKKTRPKQQPTNTTVSKVDNTVIDIDGNVYKTVKIGNQIWMAENLKTTRYNDGNPIPNIIYNNEWNNLKTGAFCYYNDEYSNNSVYGKLYNWYAVGTDKLAPIGWHVPSNAEWTELINYLGGDEIAGGKMKSTNYWKSPNKGANNSSGFTGFPAGCRIDYGQSSNDIGVYGYFWSSTEFDKDYAWPCYLHYNGSSVIRSIFVKTRGKSVRCVKD